MSGKKVLFLDLKKKSGETKNYPDLNQYLGGLAIGLHLFRENIGYDPLVFSRGPLTGAFPFTNKISILFQWKNDLKEIYGLGNFGPQLTFSGYDALVILNKAFKSLTVKIDSKEVAFVSPEIGQTSRGSWLQEVKGRVINDNFFSFGEFLGFKFRQKKLSSLVISGSGVSIPVDYNHYQKIYEEIFRKQNLIQAEKSFLRSCFGCPLGCPQASKEEGVIFKPSLPESEQKEIVPYSSLLLFCSLAASIFENLATIFSCLTCLGYNYTHEELEALPAKVWKLKKELLYELYNR